MSIKRFREFTHSATQDEDLQESSLLNKGFALTQGTRHRNAANKLLTSANKISSISSRGKSASDVSSKLNYLFDALIEFSRALENQATMSSANVNVSVASAVLSQDTQKAVAKALTKNRRKRR